MAKTSTLLFAMACITLVICRSALGSLDDDKYPNIESWPLEDGDMMVDKRTVDSLHMARVQYCLLRGRFDRRCRAMFLGNKPDSPRIRLITS